MLGNDIFYLGKESALEIKQTQTNVRLPDFILKTKDAQAWDDMKIEWVKK